MRVLVIIPAYNEQDSIVSLIQEVKEYGYDYLVINDCSTDSTNDLLKQNRISHLTLPINLGIAGVTQVGFMYASDHDYDCVICIDGDGQHLPRYMADLLNEIEKGNDYVVGSRFVSEKKPLNMRMLGSRLLCFLIRLKTGHKVSDPTSGMRALGKKVIQEFSRSMNFYAEPDALCHLIHKGYQVKEVQVEMKERESGVSYFHNPLKSIYFMLSVSLSIIFIQ
ncbi:MAG: glycosyltransferase family 2 protein [Erysipelotrichaceae bacterium]|nr:glycosyltransferase family 2 protein [Erysipelotrichaceae bacterium]